MSISEEYQQVMKIATAVLLLHKECCASCKQVIHHPGLALHEKSRCVASCLAFHEDIAPAVASRLVTLAALTELAAVHLKGWC